MKQCPRCGNQIGMAENVTSIGDQMYHRDCYLEAAAEMEASGPDPLDRIAAALEKLAEQKEREWHYSQTPWQRAEKR